MNEYGEQIAADAVRFRRLLPGSIDLVWSYLVDGEKRGKWLASGDTDAKVGGSIELNFHNAGLSTLDDDPAPEKYKDMPDKMHFDGVVTACEPKTLFQHTWRDGDEETEVTYELEAHDDGVLLTLTHRRVESRTTKTSVLGGWHTHLNILEDILRGNEPQPFWKVHTPLEEEYETRIP